MNKLTKQNINNISLQETSDALALRGIKLTAKDIQAIKQTQVLICKKCYRIETSSTILEEILSPFLDSSYMSLQNYLTVLKNIIVVYYETRSRFDYHIEDTRIIKELYNVYQTNHGEQNIEYLRTVLKNLNKERQTIK